MKLTKRKLSIIMLVVTLLLSLVFLLGINTVKTAQASGTITVSSNNVFNASSGARVAGSAVGEGADAKYYSTMSFTSDDETVSYRRNLAYNWYANVETKTTEDGEEKTVTEPQNGQFNMEIGFKNTAFQKFVITFESQQYNKTKDGKTKNYIVFYPSANEGRVYAAITSDIDYSLTEDDKQYDLDAKDIYIRFDGKYTEDYTGGYNVVVSNEGNTNAANGKFENVGGNYAKYSSSSTTPVYPLIFSAKFGENAETKNCDLVLFTLNGQSFETTSSTANTVTDDTPPVLCLEQELSYFELNGNLDIDFVVIDVLRNSPPSPTIYYYLLTYDQFNADDTDYTAEDLFTETTSSNDVLLEADKNKYMPSADVLKDTAFGASYVEKDGKLVPNTDKDKPVADMLIKIYFKLTDSSSTGEESIVYLDWYVNNEYVVKINDSDDGKFLAVAKDELGVTYNYGEKWDELKKAYQEKIDDISKNLSAGSSSYIYLPSPESLFSDNATAYTDMKFSIYYYHDSKQSNTSLASSNLSINITKQGTYTFTIYATDAQGNDMYYLEEVEKADDGQLEVDGKYYKIVEFKASDIWTMFDDADGERLYDKLPWFTFDVGYKGVEFEETPGLQSTAYVGTVYNSASFKINGISGNYTTKYRLFVFNSAEYYNKNNGATFTYQEFIDKMDGLFENPETRVYFKEIPQVSEGDADYEEYKDYGWSSTSTSFTPQDADSFYYIRAEVKDKQYLTDPVTCSLAIAATETAKTLKGEDDWAQNNIASIVLLVVAGVALIGIVLLIVIKPKEKGDVDVLLETESKKTKKNK